MVLLNVCSWRPAKSANGRFPKRDRQQRVDKRPSTEINMKLLSLNRGAIHGNRYKDRRTCNAVE
jgi:hypothetical protein